ncbi:hypothetical protein AeRB84_005714 [Aphanomyces euteiches]|nr:hypothetical protein AeRB84_005714 [Aphanomyces euteiches]
MKYCETIDCFLLPVLEKDETKNPGEDILFQQDNASIHVSAFTKSHFSDLGIKPIKWPAKSPDLNPIEIVWGALARAVYANGHQYESPDELRRSIVFEWANICQEYLSTLVDSMSTRMAQVILMRGAAIDY